MTYGQRGEGGSTVVLLSHLSAPGHVTGAERSLLALARGLTARGRLRPVVVFPRDGASLAAAREAGLEVHICRTRMLWLSSFRSPGAAYTLAQMGLFALALPRVLVLSRWMKQHGAAVAHVNSLVHVAGAMAARLAGLPVVWHVREILPPGWRRRLYAACLKRLAARIVCVSEAARAGLVEEGLGERAVVIANAAFALEDERRAALRRAGRERLGVGEGELLVAHLGQVLPHKGQVEFLRAAREVLQRFPRTRFLVMGDLDSDPDYARRVRAEAASLGASVILAGYVADAPDLLAACDLAAVTSLVPDPLPRAVLEAMAAGVAVVGFAGGGVDEMVREGVSGRLVASGDVNALAAAMRELLARSEALRTMGAAARDDVRARFDCEAHARAIEAIYDQVLSHG